MYIISEFIKKMNVYFFDSEEVNGSAYLFYGVTGLFVTMSIVFITLNIIGV